VQVNDESRRKYIEDLVDTEEPYWIENGVDCLEIQKLPGNGSGSIKKIEKCNGYRKFICEKVGNGHGCEKEPRKACRTYMLWNPAYSTGIIMVVLCAMLVTFSYCCMVRASLDIT